MEGRRPSRCIDEPSADAHDPKRTVASLGARSYDFLPTLASGTLRRGCRVQHKPMVYLKSWMAQRSCSSDNR